ncbi:MAG: DNA repair ATPase [Polyangiaceae bacterium]
MAEAGKSAGAALAEDPAGKDLEGGSYDVIRKRLLEQAAELGRRAEALNQKRVATFGGSQIALLATERIRTENNCVPRDIRMVQGKLLFGYNVFLGLKSETVVGDVFGYYDFKQTGESSFDLSQLPTGDGHFLADPMFLRDFSDLYRYNRETKLLMIRTTDTRVLAIFQVSSRLSDVRVFRWGIDKSGAVKYIDARGEEDNVLPKQHDFEFTSVRREDQRAGDHPHFSILDEVFVECVGGDLTIKVENNTADGRGIYREPVEDANQTLDDAEIAYARVGVLILIRIKPYRENDYRYFVFNTRTQQALRVDAVGEACLSLPEEQGIIFPGGYYLRTGDYKLFDGESRGMVFRRAFKAPNGEDVLYVFDRLEDGAYLLLPYNVIRKEVANPLGCHGYSVFDDGKLVIFKSLSDEPTKVHPVQIWQTPFCTQEYAAAAPTDGSYLAKVGNAELVRGISEALTLQRVATTEQPTRQTYEDVVSSCGRMIDGFYWLPNAEACDLASAVATLRGTADLIVDEFEKVAAIRKRSADALYEAEQSQRRVIDGLRPNDMKSVDDFMGSLTSLRKQRGHLITLRDMRYMNLARVDELEKEIIGAFDLVSRGAVEFLLQPTALAPLVNRLSEVVTQVGTVAKATEIKPIAEDVDKVGDGLAVLSDIINGLAIEDPTQRTRILEGISEAFSQLNRARATLVARRKELAAAEGRSEFGAQFKLFGQSVVSALALCDTPEKCDETLSRLLLSLEELEGRFGEFDEFLGDLAQKREEVTDSIAAKRQTLLDERQRRAQNIVGAADRIVAGIQRKARTFTSPDELNTYFASDAMVLKLRDLAKQLFDIGASVKGDEVESKLKSARQDALRALRDKADLFEGGDNVIRFGQHRFNVNTQAVELALVPRKDDGTGLDVQYVHLTGTDFFERLEDPLLESARDLWDQQLVSESSEVYRGEYLAASVLFAAENGQAGLTMSRLSDALLATPIEGAADSANPGLLALVREFSQSRHDEGYERGVHDVDATLILERVLALRTTGGLLRYSADARALACLAWAYVPDAERTLIHRRARSYARLFAKLETVAPLVELAAELEGRISGVAREHRLEPLPSELRVAARYLVDELAVERPRFVVSPAATALRDALRAELERSGGARDFDEDLRLLEKHPAERLVLANAWVRALLGRYPDLGPHAYAMRETAVLIATDRKLDREPSTASISASAAGLLGQHSNIKERALAIRLDEWLDRLERFARDRVPRFRAFRKTKQELLDRERRRLRLDEFSPRILSSFVRNRLIDEVYLPLVGANLAKQMGSAGEGKRTDQMGLLLLISPPGYGKTTLMEYVANKLGLIFMKVNGPALGHEVKSVDPNDAPNATARQEVDKINLALEMGNNVMLYLDDIQHTNPELLQKFISLCDAQRKIEGVWRGKTRTYDMRGKKFCVVMAGNPYTETGEKFRIPDMLANRADTYNLGDILEGKDDLFALSYLENALTSNKVLQPLSGRDPKDTHKLIRMARGESLPVSELAYPYSAAEVNEIVEVFKRLFMVQSVLLRVNLEYIASASQDDNYRTEPPFKLQGSYRNMNKVTEKIVAAHTEEEVASIVDDHYTGEAQTLTTGAENNLLKLADLRGRLSKEQAARWAEIKKGYIRVKMMGGKEDDPVARVTGALGGLAEQLDSIQKSLVTMADRSGEPGRIIAAELDKLHRALEVLAGRELLVNVERDPAIAELLSKQLAGVEATLAPVVKAIADSLLLAGQSAHHFGREQADLLRSAISEAAAKVEGIAAAQQQLARAQARQLEVMEQAQRTETSQVGQVQTLVQQVVEAQRQLAQQQATQAQAAQHAVQQVQQALLVQREMISAQQNLTAQQQQAVAAQREVAQAQAQAVQAQHHAVQAQQQAVQQATQAAQQLAHARPTPPPPAPGHRPTPPPLPPGARLTPPPLPPGGLVQRPDASAAENEAIARAQQALAAARTNQHGSPEVVAAVSRVEGRLNELGAMILQLQHRISEGVAAAQHTGGAGQAAGGGSLRYDAAIDLESPSNFYRWSPQGDVVNEGGIFVCTRRKLPNLGQELLLRLTLPGGAELEARAVVEWTRPVGQPGGQPGFGARFVDLPSYSRQLVDHFVSKRHPILFEQR